MTYYAYMLHCAGGFFYVGHTDNLDRRIAQHEAGVIPGYTQKRLPVKLVWSERFFTREDAKAAEHRIKGWSRAKKMALIRQDRDLISALARNSVQKEKTALRQAQGDGEAGII